MADDVPLPDPREPYGRIVRDTWVNWALEQPDPKPSWLAGWDELDAGQREVDMRIGSAVAAQAVHDAGLRNDRVEALLLAYANAVPVLRKALLVAIDNARHKQLMSVAREYEQALAALGEEEPDASR